MLKRRGPSAGYGSGMKRLPGSARLILAFIALAGPSGADESMSFLQPEAVRSAYELARSEWLAVPDTVRDAFLVAEDSAFHDRPPVRSSITAAITRWYPEPRARSSFGISAAIARALERDEILDWFIQGVFLGQGCFGVDGAANAYFGKRPSELDLHEAAFLAAIIPAPARYHPVRFEDRATERRNWVLLEMARHGLVSAAEAESAASEPLAVRVPPGTCQVRTE